MSHRLEILLNGERLCTTGLNGFGSHGISVYDQNPVPLPEAFREPTAHQPGVRLTVQGSIASGPITYSHFLQWVLRDLKVGDKVQITVLPSGQFDQPEVTPGEH